MVVVVLLLLLAVVVAVVAVVAAEAAVVELGLPTLAEAARARLARRFTASSWGWKVPSLPTSVKQLAATGLLS